MPGENPDNLIFIVVGASLRGERMDRPLAYRLRDVIKEQLSMAAEAGAAQAGELDCLVITDIWYLNSERLQTRPAISLGGPGVNHLAAYLLARLDPVLSIDHVLRIGMNPEHDVPKCSVWGMDHESTVEALDTFIEKGYLDRFLRACLST